MLKCKGESREGLNPMEISSRDEGDRGKYLGTKQRKKNNARETNPPPIPKKGGYDDPKIGAGETEKKANACTQRKKKQKAKLRLSEDRSRRDFIHEGGHT